MWKINARSGVGLGRKKGVEEGENGVPAFDTVVVLCEAVAFVVKDDVLDDAVIGLDGRDHVVALRLDHSRVVGALEDDQGPGDLVSMKYG